MKKYLIYTILCLFFLSSCGVSEPVFLASDNLEFKSVKDSIFNFSIDTYIYNPARLTYRLKELNFEVQYEKEKIGYGKLIHPVKIIAKDTMVLPMECSMNLDRLQEKHKELLRNQNANFILEGTAVAVHPLKTSSKDISLNLDYDVKKIIADNMFNNSVTVEQIGIEKLNPFSRNGLTKSALLLNIELQNRQHFDFQIEQIEISLRSQETNKIALKGFMNTPINVNSLESIKIPVEVESNNFNVLQDMGRFILGKGAIKYIGTGYVTIRIQEYQFEIPVQKTFNIEAKLFGNTGSKIRIPLLQNNK